MHAEAVVRDSAVTVAPVVDVSVSGDHRALDGLVAARFLDALVTHLARVRAEGMLNHG